MADDVEMTPITPEENAPVPPKVAPFGAPAAPAADASASPSAASGNALEQLKSVTQKLKGVTQEIPQQAILRKTGIIADQDLSDAQKQASKSRTARISLSDALGVAPVQNEAAPIKTIRIKRPDSIAKGPATETDAAPAEGEETETAATAAGDSSTSITQRKTLKISRPGAVRPAGKFGIKKPGAAPAGALRGPDRPGGAGKTRSTYEYCLHFQEFRSFRAPQEVRPPPHGEDGPLLRQVLRP